MFNAFWGRRVWGLVAAAALVLAGCLDIADLEAPSELNEDTIMPNAMGFLHNDYSRAGLQGGWYHYKNFGSEVTRFDATSFMHDTNPCIYNFGLPTDGGPEPECRDESSISQAVERICFEGTFGHQPGKTGEKRYAGVGFEVCSTNESNQMLYQFPYTLGTCPLQGEKTLLSKLVGISFRLTSLDGDSPPTLEKLVVQLKERQLYQDKHPSCVAFGKLEENEVACENRLEAWDGNTGEWVVRIGDVKNIDGRTVRLNSVQGIHFQAESARTDDLFSFCIEDLKAITLKTPKSSPFEGETEPIPTEIKWNTDLSYTVPDLVAEGDWKAAKDTNANEGEVQPYPDGAGFEIMKHEVTVGEYFAYYTQLPEAQIVDGEAYNVKSKSLREWDSCNLFRYTQTFEQQLQEQAVNCINFYNAKSFCKWVGGRLPTKTEWEYAARAGHADFDYPWGAGDPTCNRTWFYDFDRGGSGCGVTGEQPAGTCTKVKGNTKTGVCDMLGNLWEWVDTGYTPKSNETWARGYKIIMGGAFNTEGDSFGIDENESAEHPREPHSPTRIGFRCVRPLQKTPEETGSDS